jgi:phosphoadenosine phosphosulfate reductase
MSRRPSSEQLARWNAELRTATALDLTRWALALGGDDTVVSTNFRPYEAVLLHLATLVQPRIRVLWVDHGYNRAATYRHAEELRARLHLDLRAYLPRVTPAHREAIHGPVPDPQDEAAMQAFSAQMKLEPFQRGMRELAPRVWLTALRRDQNANRAGLDYVTWDENFQTLKVSPLLEWDDARLAVYLAAHDLPNEFDYYDPAKGDAKRECGLHAAWGRHALVGAVAEGAAR